MKIVEKGYAKIVVFALEVASHRFAQKSHEGCVGNFAVGELAGVVAGWS